MTQRGPLNPTGRYLGLMSGTSADGIDAVIVEFNRDGKLETVIATYAAVYAQRVRRRLIDLAHKPDSITLTDYAELDHAVGVAQADAAMAVLEQAHMPASAIRAAAMHGQTVFHRPPAQHGKVAGNSLQIGDPALLAARLGRPVVADCRRADLAAGGQGAPLAPGFHAAQWRQADQSRCIVNIGGIANLTVLPSVESGATVTAFDCGPGNCLMDAWADGQLGQPVDIGGAWAMTGVVDQPLLDALLSDPYFQRPAPKSTGRDHFSPAWLLDHLSKTGGAQLEDVQRTLLELTARTISDAIQTTSASGDAFVCGGGAHNSALMTRLAELMPERAVATTEALGLHPDWVEAAAWAWLAMRRANGLPGNMPSVTGAQRAVQLGAVHLAPPRNGS